MEILFYQDTLFHFWLFIPNPLHIQNYDIYIQFPKKQTILKYNLYQFQCHHFSIQVIQQNLNMNIQNQQLEQVYLVLQQGHYQFIILISNNIMFYYLNGFISILFFNFSLKFNYRFD
ncbi:unnamed protein product [Paramecium sonneborni]|uniref:Transmembrane protein n=1 Tax=Paramecium sonneborni TaxID=65129 RepID=A0A8S1MW37_9CILI|nr:unnamed protein product [Paramecium sonneborni]